VPQSIAGAADILLTNNTRDQPQASGRNTDKKRDSVNTDSICVLTSGSYQLSPSGYATLYPPAAGGALALPTAEFSVSISTSEAVFVVFDANPRIDRERAN
jgi:hypothetical protein